MMVDDIIFLLFYVSQLYCENRDAKSKEQELKSLQFRNKWNMFTVAAIGSKTRKVFFFFKIGLLPHMTTLKYSSLYILQP